MAKTMDSKVVVSAIETNRQLALEEFQKSSASHCPL